MARKIKHWAGYGCVKAFKTEDYGTSVDVIVMGNHERGLEPYYFTNYDWERWLGNRFHIGKFDRVETRVVWNDSTNEEAMQVRFIREV